MTQPLVHYATHGVLAVVLVHPGRTLQQWLCCQSNEQMPCLASPHLTLRLFPDPLSILVPMTAPSFLPC